MIEDREALLEKARQEGPEYYLLRHLHLFVAVARDAGLERDEVAADLMQHAVALCRPSREDRRALARHLVREARKLDAEAADE